MVQQSDLSVPLFLGIAAVLDDRRLHPSFRAIHQELELIPIDVAHAQAPRLPAEIDLFHRVPRFQISLAQCHPTHARRVQDQCVHVVHAQVLQAAAKRLLDLDGGRLQLIVWQGGGRRLALLGGLVPAWVSKFGLDP